MIRASKLIVLFLFLLASLWGLTLLQKQERRMPGPVTDTIVSFSAGAVANAASPTNANMSDPNIFVNLAKKVVPSVVNISTLSTVKSPFGAGDQNELFRKFFEEFFNNQRGGRGGRGGGDDQDELPRNAPKGKNLPKAMSLGTGFIIDSSGIILTNNHVVAGADEIKINFTEEAGEKPTDGEVIGRDPELDVALIKVKSKREMVPLPLGDSDNLEVGEYVMAVGNPFGQGHSVTHGIVSAKGRAAPDFPLAKYIQTDAPINPGNSGGPLLNLKGEVIGINNAIDQRAQGIGFAIPISAVKTIIPQLRSKGVVSRGYIGVLVNELTPEIASQINVSKDLKAPFVTHIYPGDPADKAGIKPYDVITQFNNTEIHSFNDLISAVTAVPVGQTAKIKVIRGGKEETLNIKVAERPGSDKMAKKGEKPRKKEKKEPAKVETGMTLEDMTPDVARELGLPDNATGAVVEAINYGGPADAAGIMRGDVILEVDRKPVKTADDFYAIVKEKKSYLLRVRRVGPQGQDSFAVIVLDLKNSG